MNLLTDKGICAMLNEKVDFDLSLLSLEELIQVFDNIEEFIQFLDDSKIDLEGDDKDA